jgi:hypothetical protein
MIIKIKTLCLKEKPLQGSSSLCTKLKDQVIEEMSKDKKLILNALWIMFHGLMDFVPSPL